MNWSSYLVYANALTLPVSIQQALSYVGPVRPGMEYAIALLPTYSIASILSRNLADYETITDKFDRRFREVLPNAGQTGEASAWLLRMFEQQFNAVELQADENYKGFNLSFEGPVLDSASGSLNYAAVGTTFYLFKHALQVEAQAF